jgi:hypothetical protein
MIQYGSRMMMQRRNTRAVRLARAIVGNVQQLMTNRGAQNDAPNV